MHYNGSNLMVFVEVNGTIKSIACATNHSMDINTEVISTSCKDADGGKWDSSEPGLSSWTMSTENLCSDCTKGATEADLVDIMLSRKPVVVVFGLEGNSPDYLDGKLEDAPATGWTPSTKAPQYKGKAYITAFNKTAQNGQLATFSATFTGTGALQKIAAGAKMSAPAVQTASTASK